jgi:hypothetical protein
MGAAAVLRHGDGRQWADFGSDSGGYGGVSLENGGRAGRVEGKRGPVSASWEKKARAKMKRPLGFELGTPVSILWTITIVLRICFAIDSV